MGTALDTWTIERKTPAGSPYGNLESGHVKEQYSVAYVHAVATRARCKLQNLDVDDEQVDVTIRQKASHRLFDRTMVDVQLKCTSQDVLKDDGVHFALKRNQYDGLTARGVAKKILVVLIVNDDFDLWMEHGDDQLLLNAQAFWMRMDGLPAITTTSKTVVLPLANRFNPEQLLDMLHRIGNGGAP